MGPTPSTKAPPAAGAAVAGRPASGADNRRRWLPMWLVRVLAIAGFLALVELAVRIEVLNPFFVPPPSDVLVRMASNLADDELLRMLGVTLAETAVGFGVAAVAGILIGFVLWRFKPMGDAFEPLVAALFSSPIVLLYPIFLVIFGRNSAAIVALAALFAVLPTILFTKQALAGVSRTLLNVGRTNNLSDWATFRHIMLPAAAPTIFTGLRIALTYVLIVVVAMEYILQIGGLGRVVAESALLFRATDLYASVGLIVVMSACFIWVINRLERLAQR